MLLGWASIFPLVFFALIGESAQLSNTWACICTAHGSMAAMSIWSFLASHLSDPGYIPRGLKAPKEFEFPIICAICESWKPPRAHHSRLLNRCVFRMDHVCRWIGNVVGYSNQKFFILLLCYGCGLCITTFLICILSFFDLPSIARECEIVRLATLIMSITGFFMLRSYFSDQVECLETNVTLIETFQNCKGPTDRVDVFRQIYGNNPVLWMFPIASSLPPNYSELVYSASPLSASDADDLDVEVKHIHQDHTEPSKKLD